MDPAHIFRQGLGSVPPRQNHTFAQPRKPSKNQDDGSDGDVPGHRIAHTLTACCRCRQRKTRCDPSLPRCLPCERSGSTCEYLDTTKGRKINRNYVIKLQDKVRLLEAELAQYTDESEYPRSNEDIVRPGGMVRLNASDETPRYLGPSSGIAMTRLLMEEAKRYTDSNRISDLIPEVRARRQARMQSIQMTGPPAMRKKSYPMISKHPAESLPTRSVADKLVEIFNQKAQLFFPVIHETTFSRDIDAVYNGDSDPYKNFIVRMVIAISLQKLDAQYAGLADSYYLAAMEFVEDVIRLKDLKTLQGLAMIGQYSLLTPTRTPVYYVVGLATRICQQEGLTAEKTITAGYSLDPLTIDSRRRLVWVVAGMEYGLAHSMGRPNGFATGDDRMDVEFFSSAADENITEDGIKPGPPSERKLAAIHFYKMRMLQAEIRRRLYERKRPEPKNDSHPWYREMENKIQAWLDASRENPAWCKAWFIGRSHQLKIFIYRPSPQVPKPSSRAAKICFKSAAHIIKLSSKELESAAVDITWVFILTLNMSLNTLLWTTSHPEVRQEHPRRQVEDLVNTALDVLDKCTERWPGTASASQLYGVFSRACLQSYESKLPQPTNAFATPPAIVEPNSSTDQYPQAANSQQIPYLNPPQFGYVFDSPPESMNTFAFDPNYPPPQPTFRSNSIFRDPSTFDYNGRRFSYFPPDFNQNNDAGLDDQTPSDSTPEQQYTSPSDRITNQLPTPPESLLAGNISTAASSTTLSPPGMLTTTPIATDASLVSVVMSTQTNMSPPQKPGLTQAQRLPAFATQQPSQPALQQRPLPPPPTNADWFSPPTPFISPYSFGSMSNSFFNDAMSGANPYGDISAAGLGLQNLGPGALGAPQFDFPSGRQDSLTQSQQLELMNVLETEGVGDIDAFLNSGGMSAQRWY